MRTDRHGGGNSRFFNSAEPPKYRGANKSLARPTSDVFCLIVRIFRLILALLYI